MKRLTGLVLAFAASALIGCGDSSVECGEGTTENDDGFCVPTGGDPVTCTDGTMLDQATNTCVIDPDSCQGGTVLIGGACVDPTDGLTVDVTEAAEPNGFDVGGELSDDPAGEFVVKPIGQKVVLQGNFTPRPDRDEDGVAESDFDTYIFQVDNPTLLEISVDGVGGAVGGFVTLSGDVQALADWIRFGIAQSGDTASRQIWLASPGIYILAVSDSRGLLGDFPAGDATNKYFVSVEAKTIPTATTLAFTNNDVVKFDKISNDEVDFYTAPLGAGFNTVDLSTFDPEMEGSLIVSVGARIRSATDEVRSTTNGDSPASAFFAGVKPTDTPIIAVDHVINTASAAVDYRLHVRTNGAVALSNNGGTATADNITPTPDMFDFDNFAQFYFDVNGTDQITGMNISWNTDVDTIVLDEDGGLVSFTTYINSLLGAGSTWTDYKGLVRTAAPGRYYVLAYDPAGLAGDDLIATSKYAAVTEGQLTFNTLLDNATPNADYNTNPYKYGTGGERWQLIDHSADTASGGTIVRYFDPTDAYGFLDDLLIDGETDFLPSDPVPVIETGAAPNGAVAQGMITIGLPEQFLVTVATFDSAGTYDLNHTMRTYADEGMHAGVVGTPYTVTHTAETLTGGVKRYLLRTTPGQSVKIDVTPSATLNASITRLDYDEFALSTVNAAAIALPETMTVVAPASGYVAFRVNAVAPSVGTTYDITITATAPTPPFYAVTEGTTPWINVCNAAGSIDVTPVTTDDALSNVLPLPTGFKFFDVDVQSIKASTNGWVSFDTAVTSSANANANIPAAAAPNTVVAPYWDDLINIRMCTQTVGTKFYIQWRGQVYQASAGTIVAFEAIFDTADDSIEFVYAPYHRGNGTTATGGVENAAGTAGSKLFFNSATALPLAGKSFKFTH